MHVPITPYPDEYILGFRGRLRFLRHCPSVTILLRDLREYYLGDGVANDMADKFPQWYVLSRAADMDTSYFIANHSLIPFHRAFDARNFGRDELGELAAKYVKHRAAAAKHGAWFCRECIEQDLLEHGMAFWRRNHQLPGVDWCHLHETRLTGALTSAFDHPPSVARPMVVSPREAATESTNSNKAVECYVKAARYVLARRKPVDFQLVTHVLQGKAITLGLIDDEGADLGLTNLLSVSFPKEWLRLFFGGKLNAGLLSVFLSSPRQRATELYLLLFSLLFGEFSNVRMEFEKLDHLAKIALPFGGSYLGGIFYDELIYSEYIRNRGKVEEIARGGSLELDETMNRLERCGLPALCSEEPSAIRALEEFYMGGSVSEVSTRNGITVEALERLLRAGGTRVSRALRKMQ